MMQDEQKLITINPLPADEPQDKKLARKKPGRKPNPNAKSARKTNEKHVMTDARKQALLKARLARAEKRKKQKEELEKISKSVDNATAVNLPDEKPNEEKEHDLHKRIGDLQSQIEEMNKQMLSMISSGVYKGSKQTEQTIPQTPTEERHRDLGKSEDSYMRVENGGVSTQKVSPQMSNMEPSPAQPKYKAPHDNIFFF